MIFEHIACSITMVFTKLFEEASSQALKQQQYEGKHSPSPNGKLKKRRRRQKGYPNESCEHIKRLDLTRADNAGAKKRRVPSPPETFPTKQQRMLTKARGPPSEAALALSARLKEFSMQKRLQDALDLYWHESNDGVRDGHHACILVDCSARCGAIAVSIQENRPHVSWLRVRTTLDHFLLFVSNF